MWAKIFKVGTAKAHFSKLMVRALAAKAEKAYEQDVFAYLES
jgi:hypothetical protein